jgi:glucose uptake protein
VCSSDLFLADVHQAHLDCLLWAILAGVVFNAANILLVAAIDLAGMAVAFPVAMGLGLAVHAVANFGRSPSGTEGFLAAGVALVVMAVVLECLVCRLPKQSGDPGSKGPSSKGLVLSVLCGLLLGGFYLLLPGGMSETFGPAEEGKIGPYATFYFFALGLLASNLVFNRLIMAWPFRGPPLGWSDYAQGTLGQHVSGLLGGMIWAAGMTCSILASGAAGPALSCGLSQAAALVALLWGLLVWREFRPTTGRVKLVLVLAFAAYLGGLSLVSTTVPVASQSKPARVALRHGGRKAFRLKDGTFHVPDVIFVPTPQRVVDKMLEMAQVKKTDVLYDLGCGDGRIVVTAAMKYGCRCKGFDVDPERIEESLKNVSQHKVGRLVKIQQKDIFELDLREASVVALYLLPALNVRLIPQLEKLKPGSRIVSHDFDMKGVTPDQVVTIDSDEDSRPHKIYLWTTPLKK